MEQRLVDAWAAGIVDGEGCITIKFRRKSKREKSAAYFSLRVLVAQSGNSIPKMLVALRRNYGGTIGSPYTQPPRPLVPKRLPRWMWTIASAQAEVFLKRIQPYIVEKADECGLALEYRSKAMGRGMWKKAREYYLKLRGLKHYEKRSDFWKTCANVV